jgi:hypothetical protein
MGDVNLGQQGLIPLGKSTTSFNPIHLEVEVSPRLEDKSKCQSFTKCVVFHV